MQTHATREAAQQSAGRPVCGTATARCAAEAEKRAGRTPLLPSNVGRISVFALSGQPGADDAVGLPVQKKLLLGSTQDPLENAADAATERVMRSTRPITPLRRDSGATPGMQAAPGVVHAALRGQGAPLDAAARSLFEPHFGIDFSRVRVHTGQVAAESAEAVQARAYTVGQNIVFGAGQYAPRTENGRRLLAHELAHTIQQRRAGDAVLRRDGKTEKAASKLPPLEPIAQRIAQLARGPNQAAAAPKVGQGAGPVVSVVRDSQTGEIYVGLNMTDVQHGSDLIERRIQEQAQRVANHEVHVVHDIAPGEHAEVHALDRAIASRQQRTGQAVTDADMGTFEVHNVWLRGSPAGTTAARCEHCAHITRGVKVTNSLFNAEANVAGEVSGEINNNTVLPDEPKTPKGPGGGGEGGEGSRERGGGGGAAVPSAGGTATAKGTPSLGGASARDAAKEILEKSATVDDLEFAAKAVRLYMEVHNFIGILKTIAESVNMAAAIMAHRSPYYKELQEADAFAARAKALDKQYGAVELRGQAPRNGDPEWDAWSSLQQVQMTWYLTESKLADALESISESRKSVTKQMKALRDALQDKQESLIFAPISLPYADVYLFGDAARQIGKSLEDADFSLREAYNQVALQQGHARVGIKMMEIRLRELGVEGLVSVDIDTADLKKAELSNFTMRK
jgi:predicted DNA-binding ArsR family transcriptional regulator